jgi:hypothetical protein
MAGMKQEYGAKKGAEVFYASKNAGKIKGVDDDCDAEEIVTRLGSMMEQLKTAGDRLDGLEQKADAGPRFVCKAHPNGDWQPYDTVQGVWKGEPVRSKDQAERICQRLNAKHVTMGDAGSGVHAHIKKRVEEGVTDLKALAQSCKENFPHVSDEHIHMAVQECAAAHEAKRRDKEQEDEREAAKAVLERDDVTSVTPAALQLDQSDFYVSTKRYQELVRSGRWKPMGQPSGGTAKVKQRNKDTGNWEEQTVYLDRQRGDAKGVKFIGVELDGGTWVATFEENGKTKRLTFGKSAGETKEEAVRYAKRKIGVDDMNQRDWRGVEQFVEEEKREKEHAADALEAEAEATNDPKIKAVLLAKALTQREEVGRTDADRPFR